MQFDELHNFHPARQIHEHNGGVAPLRGDLKRYSYIQKKKRMLLSEKVAREETELQSLKAKIVKFFADLTSGLRHQTENQRHQVAASRD